MKQCTRKPILKIRAEVAISLFAVILLTGSQAQKVISVS
jgi:hypothetical protein